MGKRARTKPHNLAQRIVKLCTLGSVVALLSLVGTGLYVDHTSGGTILDPVISAKERIQDSSRSNSDHLEANRKKLKEWATTVAAVTDVGCDWAQRATAPVCVLVVTENYPWPQVAELMDTWRTTGPTLKMNDLYLSQVVLRGNMGVGLGVDSAADAALIKELQRERYQNFTGELAMWYSQPVGDPAPVLTTTFANALTTEFATAFDQWSQHADDGQIITINSRSAFRNWGAWDYRFKHEPPLVVDFVHRHGPKDSAIGAILNIAATTDFEPTSDYAKTIRLRLDLPLPQSSEGTGSKKQNEVQLNGSFHKNSDLFKFTDKLLTNSAHTDISPWFSTDVFTMTSTKNTDCLTDSQELLEAHDDLKISLYTSSCSIQTKTAEQVAVINSWLAEHGSSDKWQVQHSGK